MSYLNLYKNVYYMLRIFYSFIILFLLSSHTSFARKYKYEYKDREHTLNENIRHLGGMYAVSWGLYYITQPTTFKEDGSFKNYRNNFGKLVFDQDEPFWNWVVHPYSGSQLFLYYRANGYSRIDAFKMTTVSSLLFEFFAEIYTEPASIQDLYQTPVLGSLLGLVFERSSLYFLNSDYFAMRFIGHILNPSSFLWFFEGKTVITPDIDPRTSRVGLNLRMEF